ncbi:hypothetical protein ACEPAI_8375 [Sanghuangporus weigelae]
MLRSGFNTIIPHKLRSAAFVAAAAPIPDAEPGAAGLSGLNITPPLVAREAEADPEAGSASDSSMNITGSCSFLGETSTISTLKDNLISVFEQKSIHGRPRSRRALPSSSYKRNLYRLSCHAYLSIRIRGIALWPTNLMSVFLHLVSISSHMSCHYRSRFHYLLFLLSARIVPPAFLSFFLSFVETLPLLLGH